MMHYFSPYEVKPKCDLHLVPPFAAINLRVAYANGSVPADLASDDANYNLIDNPASIMGKPDDVFSTLRSAKALVSTASKAVTPSGGETE